MCFCLVSGGCVSRRIARAMRRRLAHRANKIVRATRGRRSVCSAHTSNNLQRIGKALCGAFWMDLSSAHMYLLVVVLALFPGVLSCHSWRSSVVRKVLTSLLHSASSSVVGAPLLFSRAWKLLKTSQAQKDLRKLHTSIQTLSSCSVAPCHLLGAP